MCVFREWDNQLAKCNSDGNKSKKLRPSLTKALIKTFGLKFMLVGILVFLEECIFKYVYVLDSFINSLTCWDWRTYLTNNRKNIWCRIGQPLCLGQLVHYFGSDNSTITTTQAYLYATGVVLGSALYTTTHHPFFFSCQHTGMQIRVAACSLVYKKVTYI